MFVLLVSSYFYGFVGFRGRTKGCNVLPSTVEICFKSLAVSAAGLGVKRPWCTCRSSPAAGTGERFVVESALTSIIELQVAPFPSALISSLPPDTLLSLSLSGHPSLFHDGPVPSRVGSFTNRPKIKKLSVHPQKHLQEVHRFNCVSISQSHDGISLHLGLSTWSTC